MINSAKISVIVPTWNRADTIEAAISSALAQTLSPLEILVCDDGSNDDTRFRVQKFADPRIRWIEGPRGGCPAIPRNRGIAAARGDWLAFLDSDDVWLPQKLERQIEALKQSGGAAVCSNTFRTTPEVDEAGVLLPLKNSTLSWRDIILQNQVHCSSVILRKDLLKQAEGFPESPNLRVGEDYALWLRVSTMTNFTYLGEPLLIYRDDPANSVRVHSLGGWRERIQVLSNFLEWCHGQNKSNSLAAKLAKRELRKAKFKNFIFSFVNAVR